MKKSILKFCYSRLVSNLATSLICTFRVAVPIFVGLLFFGAMVWAKSEDPFVRKWFGVKVKIGKPESRNATVECVAVIPKKGEIGKAESRNSGVVVYLHDSGGTLMTDGRPLRQLAELGMVTVSLEYNQTNDVVFEEQFSAFAKAMADGSSFVKATAGKVAWVGDGLGAQNALKFLLKHPDQRPNLLVQLGGGWVPELEEFNRKERREHKRGKFLATDVTDSTDRYVKETEFLLVHGERDEVVSVAECKKVGDALSGNGGQKSEVRDQKSEDKNQSLVTSTATDSVDIRILPGLGHSFEPDRALVIRQVGEYVKAHLTPEHPLPEFPEPPCYPFLFCATPAFLWVGFWVAKRHKATRTLTADCTEDAEEGKDFKSQISEFKGGAKNTDDADIRNTLSKFEVGLRVVAGVLAVWALAETAIHLIPPRLEVSERTLQIARSKLLAPKWQQDFADLSSQPIWKGQKLKTLLTHVELAHYCVYELINWKLPSEIYRDFVLSPVVEGSEAEMNWRRLLWEFYYPRIRKENTTEAAAEIVVRTLRERVTVWPDFDRPQGIDTIWKEQITGERGFELIYMATLRSVGVPARLDSMHKAEFWDGEKWKPAPRPLLTTWHDLTGK